MKLIEIQRHFFRIKGEEQKVWFCTEAETDSNLNVIVVKYIRANKSLTLPENWQTMRTMELRGKDIKKIVSIEDGLGMPYTPASHITKLDTQVPDSMGDDTHEALRKLTKAVGGNVTDFVCERLQWSRDEVEDGREVKDFTDNFWRNNSWKDLDKDIIDTWETITKEATANRELRDIITGNILKGFDKAGDGAKLISFTMKDGTIKKGILLPKNDNNSKGGSVVAFKKYPIKKCKHILKQWSELKDTDSILSLSYGFFIFCDTRGSLYLAIDAKSNGKAIKDIINNPIWLSFGGRGFYRGWDSRVWKYVKQVELYSYWKNPNGLDDELLDKIVNAIDSVGLSVELNAQQAEQFFEEDTTSPQEKSSDWKKIPFDKTNIPQGGSKKNERKDDEKVDKSKKKLSNDKEKRRRLIFYKMKAKNAELKRLKLEENMRVNNN